MGQPIYAIGDVHGRADLLRPLLDAIADDASDQNPRVVFLGDIIDRGPDSKEALELVDDAFDRFPGSQLVLGNHDEYFLLALEGLLTEADETTWLHYGGRATIESYLPGSNPTVEQFTKFIREYYGHHHTLLLQAVDKVILGNYCLVHAGVRPGVPIIDQNLYDLRWIREEFLEHTGHFEYVIVHGHSVTQSNLPEVHSHRIAVDTGAYISNRLTACRLADDAAPIFLATSVAEGGVIVERFS